MKSIILGLFLSISLSTYGQENPQISSVDFVQILHDNKAEAIYYYEHNWKALRVKALKKNYIHSFQLLECTPSEEQPFHLMLITTYQNQAQYALREEHFGELIKSQGGLKLLNDKKPGEFRKVLFSKEKALHRH